MNKIGSFQFLKEGKLGNVLPYNIFQEGLKDKAKDLQFKSAKIIYSQLLNCTFVS